MAIQKTFFSDKRDALGIMLLQNVQGKQDLTMLNIFCATVIILQITRDIECIRNMFLALRKKTINSRALLTSMCSLNQIKLIIFK